MKSTTVAIIVVLTAMILVTAGAFNSPALAAKKSSDTSSKDTSSKDTSSKDTSSSTSGGSSSTSKGTSSVSAQLKSLISCLTSSSKLTGTMPTKAQFTTCEAQSNFGTLGGSAIGGSTSGSSAKTAGGSTSGGSTSGGSTSGSSTSGSSAKIGGGGLVPLTSGVAGPLFLGSK